MNEIVKQGSIEDRGRVEALASDGGADDGEDSGADDCSDAERSERKRAEGFPEPVLRLLGLSYELVDRFTAKCLAWQNPAPLTLMNGVYPVSGRRGNSRFRGVGIRV